MFHVFILLCALSIEGADCSQKNADTVIDLGRVQGVNLCMIEAQQGLARRGALPDGLYAKTICQREHFAEAE